MSKYFVLEFVFESGFKQIFSTIYSSDEIESQIDQNFTDMKFILDKTGNRHTTVRDGVETYQFVKTDEFSPTVIRKFPININNTSGYMFLLELRKIFPEIEDAVLPLVVEGKSRDEIADAIYDSIYD